ncbi:hypothetical protein [Shewanella marina]|uniref:hypothetical protein n=1 Tax=Shewanella marina TaxID=487319 RepID=UPI00047173FC|nr:hypothetical protein [Shewanella marina]
MVDQHKNHQTMTDDELLSLYKLQAKEQPSAELDQRIIEMAADRSNNSVRQTVWWLQPKWQLSSAASIALIVTGLWFYPVAEQSVITPTATNDIRLYSEQAADMQTARPVLRMAAVPKDSEINLGNIATSQIVEQLTLLIKQQRWDEAGVYISAIKTQRPELLDSNDAIAKDLQLLQQQWQQHQK